MTHTNRGRLTIDPLGDWAAYATLSDGESVLGTVTTGDNIGALIRSASGDYYQGIGFNRTLLNSRKVDAAIK